MEEGDNDAAPPGVLRWLISCDESGVHGSRHYGCGTLWMAWQRRGDFAALIRELRQHHFNHEIKWTNVKRGSLPFFHAIVDEFFDTSWLSFHCLVVERAVVRRELHASWDEARQKHFTMLLQRKIRDCMRAHRNRPQTFRVWLDPMHSAYPKAAEVAEIITRVIVSRQHANASLESVVERVSDSTESIQVCDLLLGAVMSAWEKDATAQAKLEIQKRIASHLGWEDLCADTWPRERKFNVWLFFDSEKGKRQSLTRPVVLKRPLPVRHVVG